MTLARSYADSATPQRELLRALGDAASAKLRELLETKHLYQKVSVETAPLTTPIMTVAAQSGMKWFPQWSGRVTKTPVFTFTANTDVVSPGAGSTQTPTYVPVSAPKVKTFCATCDSREAHAPAWADELNVAMRRTPSLLGKPSAWHETDDVSVFFLAYQCQNCDGLPVVFTVRGRGFTFWLDGRSPIEAVEVPSFLPKIEREFYRDALLALQTGRPLASAFFLRTFVEQFARRVTGKHGRELGSEIMAAYTATIDATYRGVLPSMTAEYDTLSVMLHAAKAEDSAVAESMERIRDHFDGRRLYKIAEPTPPAAAGDPK